MHFVFLYTEGRLNVPNLASSITIVQINNNKVAAFDSDNVRDFLQTVRTITQSYLEMTSSLYTPVVNVESLRYHHQNNKNYLHSIEFKYESFLRQITRDY